MAFELLNLEPDGYWSHNSGGEHTSKHIGDVADIQRLQIAQGNQPMPTSSLLRYMNRNGVVTMRTCTDGTVGNAIGYVVGDKNGGDLTVKDLYVEPAHRSNGIGGVLLGKLISEVDMNTRYAGIVSGFYGTSLEVGGQSYHLPGAHIEAWSNVLGPIETDKFIAATPENWSGVRGIDGRHEVYRAGNILGVIEEIDGGMLTVPGSTKSYPHVAFAAIDILNERK